MNPAGFQISLGTIAIIVNIVLVIAFFFVFVPLFLQFRRIAKRTKKLSQDSKATGFGYDEDQWQRNIISSGFLNNLYGNLYNAQGYIETEPHVEPLLRLFGHRKTFLKHTAVHKGYKVELFEFLIRHKAAPKKQTDKSLVTGPFFGLHINLKNNYHEVDVIYKPELTLLQKYSQSTIKPRTWKTESEDFNKRFAILSDHHVTNLQILTPDVIAMILDSELKLNIELLGNHLLLYTAKRLLAKDGLKSMMDIGFVITENLE